MPQAFAQFVNKLHFYIEGDWQVRVLVCRIDSPAHIEINICSVLKEHSRYARCAVLKYRPVIVQLVFTQIILSVVKHLAYRDNALCNYIYALNGSHRRNIGADVVKAGYNRLS